MNTLQKNILKLLSKKDYSYSQLFDNSKLKDSGHFNYHLKQLIKEELIEKNNNIYSLTTKGEMFIVYSNYWNKPSPYTVSIAIIKKENKFLVLKRDEKPFYNFYTFPGKIIESKSSPEQALTKAVKKTGLKMESKKFLGYMNNPIYYKDEIFLHAILLIFSVETKGELKNGEFKTLKQLQKEKILPGNINILKYIK